MQKIGALKLDPYTRRLSRGRRQVGLRNKEFYLMAYFMENLGKVLSRAEILEDVWDRNICCATNTVDVHVSSLRRKIEPLVGQQNIKTIHCVGYVFEI